MRVGLREKENGQQRAGLTEDREVLVLLQRKRQPKSFVGPRLDVPDVDEI
jgi:hypothetical protein